MKFHKSHSTFRPIHFYGAIFTLVGTIIGAGILGIPSVVAHSGYLTGLLVIVLIAAFFVYVYLNLGEAILRTKGQHQLPGLAERYLGKKGKFVLMITMTLGAYGALIAYMIASGEAIHSLLSYYFLLPGILQYPVTYSILFFLLMSFLILKGLNVIEDSELLITGFLLLSIVLVFCLSFFEIKPSNLTGFNLMKILIPYGTIFFAYGGFYSVPEAAIILEKNKKVLPKALVLSVVIPMVAYILFSTSIVGVMGTDTQELATNGLEFVLGPGMLLVGSLFLLFSVSTSFLAIGFAQEEMFRMDYKLSKLLSWFIAGGVPFIAFLFLANSIGFVRVLSISGALFGGLLAAIVIIISYKAKTEGKRKPEFKIKMSFPVMLFLLAILLIGVIATLFFG
jgi:tyrosine-specific transport protein